MEKHVSGYLYVVAGQKYIDEAIISAGSLRHVNPDAHITIIADREVRGDLFDQTIVRPMENRSLREESLYDQAWKEGLTFRVKHIYNESPYEKTLFIDSDTYFYDGCEGIFDLLDYFDISMAIAPNDRTPTFVNGKCLTGYTPYNCGVILFKKNSKNEALFKQWFNIYEQKLKKNALHSRGESDQTSFMEALLESESRIYTLANEWNARLPFFLNLTEPVKVVHGRYGDYDQLRKKINWPVEQRCWNPQQKKCIYKKKNIFYYLYQLHKREKYSYYVRQLRRKKNAYHKSISSLLRKMTSNFT
jgi:hypothetical protein